MTDQLVAALAPALTGLLVAVLLALLSQATLWLRAHTKNVKVQGAITRASDDIAAFVAKQAQVVDAARGDDGKLSLEDAARAKGTVLANLLALWNVNGAAAELKKIVGLDDAQLQAWTSARVEQAVRDLATSDVTTTTTKSPAQDITTTTTTSAPSTLAGPLTTIALIFGVFVMLATTSSCNTIKAAASAAIDCTTPAAKKLVDEFTPAVESAFSHATASDGSIDRGLVKSATKSFAADIGSCVLASVVKRALTPSSDPNAPKSSPLEARPDEVRAVFEEIRKGQLGGATFKTETGEL